MVKRVNAQKSQKQITHAEQFANQVLVVDEHGKVIIDRYWDVVTEGYYTEVVEDRKWPQKIA